MCKHDVVDKFVKQYRYMRMYHSITVSIVIGITHCQSVDTLARA